ncbi:hypothetical protein CU098_013293 [Rhizopus stolonifer]|uniref:DUF1772 domain-containing protein n=2 Tax=Mucorineae TaxID=1344963 RepID=A0A367KVR2_RHIST|nr:hypothetical protein CU098_013293 [Rhizopus stolonifer]
MSTSLYSLIYVPRSIALLSSGLFAGASISINYTNVPAIKASKDPLPVFVKTYKQGAKQAITEILVSTAAGAACYYYTHDKRFVYASIASFFSAPFTAFAIAPVNNQLFALEKQGDNYDRKKVYELVKKWNKLHAVRTCASIIAFLIHVLY